MPASDGEFEQQVQARGQALALAFNDPAVIAAKIAEWIRAVAPERLAAASWITVEGDPRRDEGIEITIYEKKMPKLKGLILRATGLIGTWSAGLGISSPIFSDDSTTVSIGVGVVAPFSNLKALAPVVSVSVRFGG